jgi:hypothetical protein
MPTSDKSTSVVDANTADACCTRVTASRRVFAAPFESAGSSSGSVVSTAASFVKSGSGSLAVRFWNAAFFLANRLTARLYAESVVIQICRRIAS